MYLFPKFDFPLKFIQYSQSINKAADTVYALEMLNQTGVCMAPGSGFGQQPNTFHIRSTFLPSESDMDDFIQKIVKFHQEFLAKYK